MNQKKPFVLCISGISATGKTIVAEYLKKKHGFQIIHLDRYAYEDVSSLPLFKYQSIEGVNYELPESINWDGFLTTLRSMKANKKYIIDGFIPFAFPEVESYVDVLIDIEFDQSDFAEGLRRRVFRDTESQVPTDYKTHPKKTTVHYCAFYFEHFVWPEAFLHPEYRVPVDWDKPILKLSGRSSIKQNCDKSDKFVTTFLHRNKPFILCISGISTSGKSTVSNYIEKKFGFGVIHLDDYVFNDRKKLPKFSLENVTGINYELPESIDWESFVSDLMNLNKYKNYIIDGFIPFYSNEILSFVDCLIDIEFNENEYSVALQRRVKRDTGNNVPDDYESYPMKSSAHFCAFYFKNFVWKEAFLHPEYRLPLNWNKPFLKLSATSPIENNCNESVKFLSEILKKV